MTPMKIGVLGVSRHFFLRVLPGLNKSQTVTVWGVASRGGEKAREAALQFGIPQYYASYEELLQDPEIEMVFIPLPNDIHAEWIKKAADHGKQILCEKPLAMNAAETKDAILYAEGKGVKIMEAFMYKFHPQWQHARELIKHGEIGRIRTIFTFFGYFNTDPKNIRNIKENGGGGLYDIGCYAVSTARFLLGAEPKRALAMMDFDENFQTDIVTNGMLDFGGVRTQFTVSTQTFPSQRVQVFGTLGVLTVEVPFNMYPDVPAKLTVQTGVGTRCVELGPADQYQLEFEAFARAIREGQEQPVSSLDAINNMKVLDALFKSAQTGQWETI